jgi:hypothetical protein
MDRSTELVPALPTPPLPNSTLFNEWWLLISSTNYKPNSVCFIQQWQRLQFQINASPSWSVCIYNILGGGGERERERECVCVCVCREREGDEQRNIGYAVLENGDSFKLCVCFMISSGVLRVEDAIGFRVIGIAVPAMSWSKNVIKDKISWRRFQSAYAHSTSWLTIIIF